MAVNLNMQLTPNFQLWEFVKSVTADLNGIDNMPSSEEIAHLRRLCENILQPARDALGPLRISSGFRSARLNELVGGVSNSAHRLGFAADVFPISVGTLAFARWVNNNTSFDQLILEFGTIEVPNWIHISCDPRGRGETLRTISSGTSFIEL